MEDRALAAVFDLDGTLVDNMGVHAEAWVDAARRHGADVSRERFEQEWAGKKGEEIWPLVLGRSVARDEAARLVEEKDALYRERYRDRVVEVPGATALVARLRAAGLRLALATAAPAANRALVLSALGLASAFDAIVGPEHVPRGKPAPDLFLAAARAIGVEPIRAVAFDDGVLGIAAARGAGMLAVGIATTAPAAALRAAGAAFVLRDFRTLPPALAARLGLDRDAG